MKRQFVFAVAFLATPAIAQEADQADIDAMTAAIVEAGCLVTAENGDAVLAASGLDDQATFAVIAALHNAGLVSLQEDGAMKLTNEACP